MNATDGLSRVRIHGLSDIGKVRDENQDALLMHRPTDPQEVRSHGILVAVADGMGGLEGGRVASQLAIETLQKKYYDSTGDVAAILEEAAKEANRVIHEYSQEKGGGQPMGSTLTALAILEDYACIAQVGDSRAYSYKKRELRQITRDHSLLRELEDRGEIDRGSVLYNYHRNVLTRALGLREEVELDFFELRDYEEGDLFLLSSDGFHELLTEEEIAEEIDEYGDDLEGLSQRFVQRARDRGGPDNITVALIVVGELQGRRAAEATELPAASPETVADSSPPASRHAWAISLAIFLSFLAGAGVTLLLDGGRVDLPPGIERSRKIADELIETLQGEESTAPEAGSLLEKIREIRSHLEPSE